MTEKTTARPAANVLLVGVGGQGIVLASQVLARLAFEAGLDVKQNEVHGLSQRGGSVTGHVRWGEEVFTPVIMEGEADFLLSLEELEALRWAHFVRPGGLIVTGRRHILPASVTAGGQDYPEDIPALLGEYAETLSVPGYEIALELGVPRAANVVLLGAMSARVPGFSGEEWISAVKAHVPEKYLDVNMKAFERGRAAAG
ncbi:MAG: indolepyruvate oxidoreductase subunit beta [Planctomycetota bacterium]|jgi:indolepyruvate ferredoxin oxidoreductase beta subunit